MSATKIALAMALIVPVMAGCSDSNRAKRDALAAQRAQWNVANPGSLHGGPRTPATSDPWSRDPAYGRGNEQRNLWGQQPGGIPNPFDPYSGMTEEVYCRHYSSAPQCARQGGLQNPDGTLNQSGRDQRNQAKSPAGTPGKDKPKDKDEDSSLYYSSNTSRWREMGCKTSDRDSDQDGIPDECDSHPNDVNGYLVAVGLIDADTLKESVLDQCQDEFGDEAARKLRENLDPKKKIPLLGLTYGKRSALNLAVAAAVLLEQARNSDSSVNVVGALLNDSTPISAVKRSVLDKQGVTIMSGGNGAGSVIMPLNVDGGRFRLDELSAVGGTIKTRSENDAFLLVAEAMVYSTDVDEISVKISDRMKRAAGGTENTRDAGLLFVFADGMIVADTFDIVEHDLPGGMKDRLKDFESKREYSIDLRRREPVHLVVMMAVMEQKKDKDADKMIHNNVFVSFGDEGGWEERPWNKWQLLPEDIATYESLLEKDSGSVILNSKFGKQFIYDGQAGSGPDS